MDLAYGKRKRSSSDEEEESRPYKRQKYDVIISRKRKRSDDKNMTCSPLKRHKAESQAPVEQSVIYPVELSDSDRVEQPESNLVEQVASGQETSDSEESTSSAEPEDLNYDPRTLVRLGRRAESSVGAAPTSLVTLRDVTSSIERCILGVDDAPVITNCIRFEEDVFHSTVVVVNNQITDEAIQQEAPIFGQRFRGPIALCPEYRLHKELLSCVISVCSPSSFIKEYGSLDKGRIMTNEPMQTLRACYLLEPETQNLGRKRKKLTIEKLCMPLWLQIQQNYPTPLTGNTEHMIQNYRELTAASRMLGLDYENLQDPSRVAVVRENMTIAMDRLITNPQRPNEEAMYRRRFKNDFSNDLYQNRITLAAARAMIRTFITPSTVLVGHDLREDLRVSNGHFPYICDTLHLYNLSSFRNMFHRLEHLARNFFWFRRADHYPANDSKSAIDLVKRIFFWGLESANYYLKSRSRNLLSRGNARIICSANAHNNYMIARAFLFDKAVDHIEFHEAVNNEEAIAATAGNGNDVMKIIHLESDLDAETLNAHVTTIWENAAGGTAIFIIFPTLFMETGKLYVSLKRASDQEREVQTAARHEILREQRRLDGRTIFGKCREKIQESCTIM